MSVYINSTTKKVYKVKNSIQLKTLLTRLSVYYATLKECF